MKDISIYFKPNEADVSINRLSVLAHDQNGFPEISSEKGVAFIHVPEYRNSDIHLSEGSLEFRSHLYKLNKGDSWDFPIYDLGTILPGDKVEDTYFAISQVISELVKNNVVPIVIGGSQDLTLACYKGFEALEQMINICSIDSKLDIGEPESPINSDAYVSHLLMQRPCFLFNYANIGLQRPLVAKKELDLFEKLYFDTCRLGQVAGDFKLSEPHLRNSDILSIDFSSIKNSETDSSCYPNVNGLYSEQICQMAKYAGISDKLSCLGIFELDPNQNSSASNLLSQIIWYFIDGYSQRIGDFPIGSRKQYTKFHVHLDDFEDDLVFYKSDKSSRWWLEVKYLSKDDKKYERHCLVPCNHEDYENAMKNVIPNLWWKTLQKLS